MNLYMESVGTANEPNREMLNRREALTKAGCLTLSAATMMILMKSQPAKAASTLPVAPNAAPASGETWARTSR